MATPRRLSDPMAGTLDPASQSAASPSVQSGVLRRQESWDSRRIAQDTKPKLFPTAARATVAVLPRIRTKGPKLKKFMEEASVRHKPRALRSTDVGSWFLAFWFSPDGTTFAAGAKEIYLYDTQTGKQTLACKRTSLVYASSCSPDGVLFCVGDEEGHLVVYYLGPPARKEGEAPPKLWEKKLESSVTDAVFSKDGKWIVTITRSGEAAIHDAIDGKQPARTLSRKGAPFRACGGHEHVSTIVSTCACGAIPTTTLISKYAL